jgi:hypothetical protein
VVGAGAILGIPEPGVARFRIIPFEIADFGVAGFRIIAFEIPDVRILRFPLVIPCRRALPSGRSQAAQA